MARPWRIRREQRPPGIPKNQASPLFPRPCIKCRAEFGSPDPRRVQICPRCKEENAKLSRREAIGPQSLSPLRELPPDPDGGF